MCQCEFTIAPDELSLKDLWLAVGYGETEPEANVRALAEEIVRRTVPAARMRYMYRIVEAVRLSPGQVRLDGADFHTGGIIGSYLGGMTHACIFVATAGVEFDSAVRAVNSEGDIVADFIADSVGTVLAELAVSRLERDLAPLAGLSMPYSPGYCGWDIKEQQQFFRLFPPQPCGIHLSESSLMTPEKSISGFFAMGEHLQRQPYHCDICKNSKCYKRRSA